MNNITVVNGAGVLAPETVSKIAEYERMKKELDEKEKALKDAIKGEMEALNLIKIENDAMVVTYVAATTSLRFDSKRFKEDNPDMYDEYLKVSPVASQVRIKLR